MNMTATAQAVPASIERKSLHWPLVVLGAVNLLPPPRASGSINHCPEPDTDAAGHIGIARALLADPTNVAIHWVWLPAYHFVLALFLRAGLSADGIRILNGVLAASVPVLLLRYGESTLDKSLRAPSRHVPWMAAVLCAISPLVNLLGTSAQHETLLTLVVIGAVWSIDAGRFALAGALLAFAALTRYEAWGAVALIVGLRAAVQVKAIAPRVPVPVARACRLPLRSSSPRSSPSADRCSPTSCPTGSGSGSFASCTATLTCSATACTGACWGFR